MENTSKAPHAECATCPLFEMPCVPTERPANWRGGKGSILIIGEAPGEEEVGTGKPFVGRSGKLLNAELSRVGINRDDVYITNAVLCRPPGNKMAKYPEAVDRCRKRLISEVRAARPSRVLLMGSTAHSAIYPESEEGIMAVHGQHRRSEELDAVTVALFHPAYMLYMPGQILNFRKDMAEIWDSKPQVADTEYEIFDTPEQIEGLIERIAEETYLWDEMREDPIQMACDTETSSLEAWNGYLLCAQLTWKAGHSVIFTEALLQTEECHKVLNELFSLPGITWWGHNFGFDYIWFKRGGFKPPQQWYDTLLCHYLTDETRGGHGLKDLGQSILGVPDWEPDILKYVKRGPKWARRPEGSYANIPKPVLYKYAARDTDVNIQIADPVWMSMEPNARDCYKEILQPAQIVLAEMEDRGILIDMPKLEDMLRRYSRKRNDMLYYLQKMTWPGFNPNSTADVAHKLFDDEGFRIVKHTPGGKPSTKVDVLDALLEEEPDNQFLRLMHEYRSIDKVITTYLIGIRDGVDKDGLVHPDFNLAGTMTGRLTAGRYLTLPRVTKNKWASPIRELVIAHPGYVIVGCDYQQAELKIMACEARETVWQQIWEQGRNLHDEMCFNLFGVHKKEDHEKYMIAKMFTFGLGYGRTAESIAKQLRWPDEKARDFHRRYMDAIPKVKAWMDWIRNETRTVGYLETAFGRKRRFPMITPATRNHIMNEALNFIPQSTANDLALMSMTQYFHEIRKRDIGWPILMLHDGIYLEVKKAYAEEAGARLLQIMEAIPAERYDTFVRFTADMKIGHSWGEAEREDE